MNGYIEEVITKIKRYLSHIKVIQKCECSYMRFDFATRSVYSNIFDKEILEVKITVDKDLYDGYNVMNRLRGKMTIEEKIEKLCNDFNFKLKITKQYEDNNI